ncbi:MAG TPA: aminotransferase class V-fold PLP-dependent enzyme [Gaiellaceae bacterium]|nr:aminotransferase class V-fold PLP-dependent enzyme [Gaiellaceae bacterium]
MIDLERVRADTPGVAHVAHLNNAGSSLPPRQVHDAVVDHLQREAEIGGYEAARERKDRWEHTYDALARLLNTEREEIAVLENATRAWDMAFYAFPFAPGDRILTGRAEYASNWIALKQVTDRTGARIDVVPDDEHGQIDVAALESMIDDDVKLVSLVHVPTQSGLVNPAAEVGRVTRAAGIPLLLDACQSAGQIPLDVEELGCDILSGTGRKFLRAPRGTGFLYVRRGLIEELEPPLLDMRAADWQPDGTYTIRPDARRFENWETYYAGKVGLGVAVDYALDIGIEAIRARIVELAEQLRAALRELDGVTLLDRGEVLAATVTFTVDGVAPDEVQRRLEERAVNVSTMDASSAQLDYGPRGITESVRSSVHYYNDTGDLNRLVEGVKEITWSRS